MNDVPCRPRPTPPTQFTFKQVTLSHGTFVNNTRPHTELSYSIKFILRPCQHCWLLPVPVQHRLPNLMQNIRPAWSKVCYYSSFELVLMMESSLTTPYHPIAFPLLAFYDFTRARRAPRQVMSITGVVISSNCMRISFLLKRRNLNITGLIFKILEQKVVTLFL